MKAASPCPVGSWVLIVAIAQYAVLTLMDADVPGSLRSPQSGSSSLQSSSPRRWEERGNRTSGSGSRSEHCSGV